MKLSILAGITILLSGAPITASADPTSSDRLGRELLQLFTEAHIQEQDKLIQSQASCLAKMQEAMTAMELFIDDPSPSHLVTNARTGEMVSPWKDQWRTAYTMWQHAKTDCWK